MGLLGGVFDFLSDLGVDQETITQIEAMLEQNRSMLGESRPSGQTDGAFGLSAAGQDLDAQTMTAHEHVIEALEEMMAGLRAYASNVARFGDDMFGLDADVQSALMRGTREAETFSASDDFHDNGIAPPAQPEGEGGDR